MGRLAALYASLQAGMIGWLASGGSLPLAAQRATPADDGAWAQAQAPPTFPQQTAAQQEPIAAGSRAALVDADVVVVTTMAR
jgi:hypothetical protein